MNKETFNQLLLNPAQVPPKHKEELRKLVNDFPYASSIRILYLSALLNDADVHFEEELTKTAAYITDRSVLKALLAPPPKKEDYIVPEKKEAPLTVIKSDPEEKQEAEENKLETAPRVETEGLNTDATEETIPAEAMAEKTTEEKTPESDAPVETAPEQKEAEITTEKNANTVPTEAEEKTIAPAGTKTAESEERTEKPAAETPTKSNIPELEAQILSSAVSASLSMEVDDIANSINAEKDAEKAIEEENKAVEKIDTEPKTFLEWISNENQSTPTQNTNTTKSDERKIFRKKAEDLIDQFIKSQPKIKPKKEFYSPENMAQKSLVDNDSFVTETLANVYANQGNISKAINIYEQLILKNPEKKSYFASLIKNLREDK